MSVTDEAYRNVVELLTSRINKIADLESSNADLLAALEKIENHDLCDDSYQVMESWEAHKMLVGELKDIARAAIDAEKARPK